AGILEYNVTVQASATVRPTGDLRIVEATQAGTVQRIEVQENQQVKAGETIAQLDDTRLNVQKNQLQGAIAQLEQQIQQIQAQIVVLDGQIVAETQENQSAIAAARAELAGNRREYRDRTRNTQKDVAAAEAELRRISAEFIAAEANLRAIEASLQSARDKFNRYRPLAQQGGISQDQWAEAQLAVTQGEQDRLGAIQELKMRAAAVEAARIAVEKAQTALNPNPTEVAIAQEQIRREQATGAARIATLKREQESLIQQQIELEQQRDRDRQQLQQIKTDLQATTITAPTSGTILQLQLRNPSQSVQSGQEIAQISPHQAPLALEVHLPTTEIQTVAVGQTAQIRISACPYPDYGTLTGTVQSISADTIQSNESSQAFYKVTLQPENTTFGQDNHQCTLQAGMEGRADILAHQETVLQFILRKARLISNL
ncbi:MAG: HlyD family efflux transporter periplasmic adaptor subunit, partial [Kamptonema sp. SIO4C4]|nr:HlyD family efflux transporter periplasmic adaptor subunit [Kamptonema sp. SIO4C4]